jgi:hypothetical protein
MLLRPVVLGLAVAILAGSTATAEPGLLEMAGPCLEDADTAICLLRSVAALNPSDLSDDVVLRARRELLKAAGVDLEKRPPLGATPTSHDFGLNLAQAALAALESGTSATKAFAPIEAADNGWAALGEAPRPMQTSPRLVAYRHLWDLSQAGAKALAAPATRLMVLQRWEEALRTHDRDDAATDPSALIVAYRLLGDEAGVSRSLELSPINSDREKLSRLIEAGRLSEAVGFSAKASIAGDEAAFRQQFEANEAAEYALQDKFQAQLAKGVRGLAKAWRESGRQEEADKLEAELDKALERSPPSHEEAARAEVPMSAWARLTYTRSRLVNALLATGQAAEARQVAYQILDAPQASWFAGYWDREMVLKAAAPERASAWLAAVERMLEAKALKEEDRAVAAEAVLSGWVALGDVQRADRLWRSWMPRAKAELASHEAGGYEATPFADVIRAFLIAHDKPGEAPALFAGEEAQLLRNDIVRGRLGTARGRIQETRNPDVRALLIGECVTVTRFSKTFELGEWCLGQASTDKADVRQTYALRSMAIGLASDAAEADQLSMARRLFKTAATADAELPADQMRDNLQALRMAHQLAKAQLRAEGRLPPLPAEASQ